VTMAVPEFFPVHEWLVYTSDRREPPRTSSEAP
jgi:hypothetical protein